MKDTIICVCGSECDISRDMDNNAEWISEDRFTFIHSCLTCDRIIEEDFELVQLKFIKH